MPITLTADGRQFLETAEEVVRLLTLSRADFRTRSDGAGLPVVTITALTALLVCFLGAICLPRTRMPRVEFYHTVLVVTAAMMLRGLG